MAEVISHLDGIEAHLIRSLALAQQSVFICVAWINPAIFGSSIRDLILRGIKVQVICNNDHNNIPFLQFSESIGLDLVAVSRNGRAIMHHKFCIIDGTVLLTGSYNWSGNAKWNKENLIEIRGDFENAKVFLHEFLDIFEFSRSKKVVVSDRCNACGSILSNIGIIGNTSELYQPTKQEVWSICDAKRHVNCLSKNYTYFLLPLLGLDGEEEDRDEPIRNANDMWRLLQKERHQNESLRAAFGFHRGPIHAVGYIEAPDAAWAMKYEMGPSYVIRFIWRHVTRREMLPKQLQDYEGQVSAIIGAHL